MNIQQLLTTNYDILPMEVRHYILGEAAYYLDEVIATGSVPGIKGYHIFPVMNSWCEVDGDYIEACLAGIWYMGRTGMTRGAHSNNGSNALNYLDHIRMVDVAALHLLVGLSEPLHEAYYYNPWHPGAVHSRMHMLRQHLPTMDTTYRTLGGQEIWLCKQ